VRAAVRAPALLFFLLAVGCGPLHHAPVDRRLLYGETGRTSATLSADGRDRLRVVVSGDAQGNRPVHRAVVAAIERERPDLVLFAGDAIDCLPVGHLPDYGGWSYLIPLWPQVVRGYPAVALASLIPFPALVHETLLGPIRPPRDASGLNGFLEDTEVLRRTGVPYLMAPGNHDQYHRADREDFARFFGYGDQEGRSTERLWYSVDAAGWRFIVLDSGTDLFGDGDPMQPGGAQLGWLEERLADAERSELHVIVMVHVPPYSSGREEGAAPWLRERLAEGVLFRYPVALVVSGHVHAYERIVRPGYRGRPLTFLVSGGAGGRFFHAAETRDPGSVLFVEEVRHFVLLEIGPNGIRGEMVPVSVPGTEPPGSAEPPGPGDRFVIDVRRRR
jgi:3',5'-cyclic AMP phosphodiesterase CpdA